MCFLSARMYRLWSSSRHFDVTYGGYLLSRLLSALPAEINHAADYEDHEEADIAEGPSPWIGGGEVRWGVKDSHLAKSNEGEGKR